MKSIHNPIPSNGSPASRNRSPKLEGSGKAGKCTHLGLDSLQEMRLPATASAN
jgi:hypothetical protein